MGEGMKLREPAMDRLKLRPVTYIDLDTMDTNFKPVDLPRAEGR